jgi:hypothetical protein
MIKQNIFILFLLSFFILMGCVTTQNDTEKKKGTLKGNVHVGPLCPHEPCNLSAKQMAEVYARYNIYVFDTKRTKLLNTIALKADGSYKISLNPGNYVIDIINDLDPSMKPQIGMRSPDLPKEIKISSGKTVKLDINIDTGIR